MIKTNFVILLCIHLLGDFYFQTQKMAERKQKQFSWTVYHCLIYAVCAWGLFFLFMPGLGLRYIFVFSLAHAVIDMMKYVICRYCSGKYQILSGVLSSRNIFLADQTLHLILLMVIFIAIEQYSAVGLVLTAKSIARYDRISKDQIFAEYYLLGTLLSTLCAVVTAVIFL